MSLIILRAKDVARILSVTERTGQRYLRRIKDFRSKEVRRGVTLKEFCDYEDLNYTQIRSAYFTT